MSKRHPYGTARLVGDIGFAVFALSAVPIFFFGILLAVPPAPDTASGAVIALQTVGGVRYFTSFQASLYESLYWAQIGGVAVWLMSLPFDRRMFWRNHSR